MTHHQQNKTKTPPLQRHQPHSQQPLPQPPNRMPPPRGNPSENCSLEGVGEGTPRKRPPNPHSLLPAHLPPRPGQSPRAPATLASEATEDPLPQRPLSPNPKRGGRPLASPCRTGGALSTGGPTRRGPRGCRSQRKGRRKMCRSPSGQSPLPDRGMRGSFPQLGDGHDRRILFFSTEYKTNYRYLIDFISRRKFVD